jgi:Transposase DDE domain group 1
MTHPTGESESDALRFDFDRRLMLQFRGSVVTSDAGLLAYRELDDALGLSAMAGKMLADARTGKNGRHALVGLLRQSVFGRLAGYEDVNDAERLRHDPAMRWIVGGKAAQGSAASPSQMGRFETQWLAAPRNLAALADLSGQWIDLVHGRRPPRGIVLDMDSSVSPTHGEQEMSVWNGHYACTCYHPLFVFNHFGDLERCALRPGNVHSADGWKEVLYPVVARYRGKVSRIYFRADAGFANPEVYEFPRRRLHRHQPVASGRQGRKPAPCEQWIKEGKGAIKWTQLHLVRRSPDGVRAGSRSRPVESGWPEATSP